MLEFTKRAVKRCIKSSNYEIPRFVSIPLFLKTKYSSIDCEWWWSGSPKEYTGYTEIQFTPSFANNVDDLSLNYTSIDPNSSGNLMILFANKSPCIVFLWCGWQRVAKGQKSSWPSIQKSHRKQRETKQNHFSPSARRAMGDKERQRGTKQTHLSPACRNHLGPGSFLCKNWEPQLITL